MSRKPSILFINRVYPPKQDATARILFDAERWFKKSGWDVHVASLSAPKPKGILAYCLQWRSLLSKARRAPKCDVVVSMTDPPMCILIGDKIAKKRKSKHIHWCQDVYPDIAIALNYPIPKFFSNVLQKWGTSALKRCDRIIVIGRCMARVIAKKGVDIKLITTIPNWPNTEINKKRQNKEPVQTSLKLIQERFRVLYAGNIGRIHDASTILNAAKIIAKTHKDIEFVLVGGGDSFDEIAQLRAKQGLDNIRLLPRQPKDSLYDLMASGDVHLVSLRHEITGLSVPCKLYSAIAAERPCIFIGSMESEISRVINDFGAGAVVDSLDNGRALAMQIIKYREDVNAWFSANKGAKKAKRIFTKRASLKAFETRAREL